MTPVQHLSDTLARSTESRPASAERCSSLWLELVSGNLQIAQTLAWERRSVMLLQAPQFAVPPLGARALEVLQRTLLGDPRKVIACEANISPSTVAQVLKESLAAMGLDCRPSLVPSSLVTLVHAAHAECAPVGLFIGDCESEGSRFAIVTHLFDDAVLQGLSPSERAVLRSLASGRSSTDIAARRKRSYRTITNQIANACRRLGVSGRLELLRHFATLPAGVAREQ